MLIDCWDLQITVLAAVSLSSLPVTLTYPRIQQRGISWKSVRGGTQGLLLMATEYWRMSDDSALIILSESDYKMNYLFSCWVMKLSAVCISISSAVNTMDSLRLKILLFATKEILTWSIDYDSSAKVDKQTKLSDENR